MRPFFARHWFLLVLAGALTCALAFAESVTWLTAPLQPRVVIAAALFLMSWTMPSRSLLGELRRPWAALWAIALSYGLLPLAAWLAGSLAPWPDLRIGLLLSASVPCTLASAVLWTRLAAGNDATALFVAVGTTALSWALTTFWLVATTGATVALRPGTLMFDLAMTLLVPVGLGQVLRLPARVRGFATRQARLLGVLAQLLVLSIILKTAAEVGLRAGEQSTGLTFPFIAASAGFTMSLHLGVLFAGLYSSGLLGMDRPRQIAVAISCSQKTLPLALYLFHGYYCDAFPLAVVPLLFYHVGQLLFDTFIARRLAGVLRVQDRHPDS